MRPRALDLFCGAGGASEGLRRAGYDVVGVDIRPMPRHRGITIRGDALRPPVRLEDFDLVWASPPCQAYSSSTRAARKRGVEYPDLVDATRELLQARARVWVIENVVGAPLHPSLMLCGLMFGLKVLRHRWFETSHLVFAPPHPSHRGVRIGEDGMVCVVSGGRQTTSWRGRKSNMGYARLAEARAAMGIAWMNRREITQAIPPAYSEWIGRQLLPAAQASR